MENPADEFDAVMGPGAQPDGPAPGSFETLMENNHVLLACGCKGYILKVHRDEFKEDQWFKIRTTHGKCTKYGDYQVFYTEAAPAPFPLEDTFYADSFPRVFPFELTPPPSWYPSLDGGPVLAANNRYVLLRTGAANILMPARLMSRNVYEISSQMRAMITGNFSSVEVIEDGRDSKVILDEYKEKNSATNRDRDMNSLYEYIIVAYLNMGSMEGWIEINGKCPLSTADVTTVLERASAHPLRKDRKVLVTSQEGTTVTLDENGVKEVEKEKAEV